MKHRKFCFAVLMVSSILLAGCAGVRAKDSSDLKKAAMLEPAVMQKFSDVPVPSNFKFMEKNSYSFESSGMRVGVLKYHGKADPDQVVSFYKEQMPMYTWTLLNVVEYGDRLMNFDRDNETCIISIMANGNSVDIVASIGPKPQGLVKRASK